MLSLAICAQLWLFSDSGDTICFFGTNYSCSTDYIFPLIIILCFFVWVNVKIKASMRSMGNSC